MSDPPILQENPQLSVKTTRFLVLNLPLWWPSAKCLNIFTTGFTLDISNIIEVYTVIGYTTKVHQRQKGGVNLSSHLFVLVLQLKCGVAREQPVNWVKRYVCSQTELVTLVSEKFCWWKSMKKSWQPSESPFFWLVTTTWKIPIHGYRMKSAYPTMKSPAFSWFSIKSLSHEFLLVQYPHCAIVHG